MKALAVITSILLISSIGWSLNLEDRQEVRPPQEATSPCYSCSTHTNSTAENLRSIRNTVAANLSVSELLKTNEVMNFAKKCDRFVSEKGLGEWGQTIVNELRNNSRYSSFYSGTDDLHAVCPGYKDLENNSKELIWVMILNAMAHLESSCDETGTARATNGKAIGLLQLDTDREYKYAKEACIRGAGRRPHETFRCGLAMLNNQLTKHKALFSTESYWSVLRAKKGSTSFRKIQAAIQKLSVCK